MPGINDCAASLPEPLGAWIAFDKLAADLVDTSL